MTVTVFLTSLVVIGLLVAAWQCFEEEYIGAGLLFFVLSTGMLSVTISVWQSPAEKLEEALKEQATRAAEVAPRKISSADGCTVYAFKPQERWLYFTKCEMAETTTQNSYSVQYGKTTRTETMEIKTK